MSAMADPPRLQGRDIVCVGFADWATDLQTNQHHLMKRLARENRVLFVESLGLRRPQLAGRDVRRIARRLLRGLRGPRQADGLHVLSPLVLPLHGNPLARRVNAWLLPGLVRRAMRRLGMRAPILWAYVPQAEALLEALHPDIVVYHCVDDIAAQPGIDGPSFRASETRFVEHADLVLASAPGLAERLRTISRNVLYAPNVADVQLFSSALRDGPLDAGMAGLPGPRIVFTGAVVTTKLDMDLLVVLAAIRRNWSFALVGPVGPGDPRADVSRLAAEPNIHLLGTRSYEQLPSVLRAAGAGLIPYALNELTRSIFPMKVYEYLAAGLPVVATPLPSLAEVEGVDSAPDAEGIARLLDEALARDTPERSAARSHAAEAHSWERRLEEIATAIDALTPPPSPGSEASSLRPPPSRPDRAAPRPPPSRPNRAALRSAPSCPDPPVGDLLVTTHTPVLRSGRDVRTYGIARALAAAGPLTLLYARFGAPAPDPAFREIPGIELREVVPSRGLRRALAYVRARLAGVPDGFARGISPELAATAAQLASAPSRRRVIADGPTAAAALSGLARRLPVIYNAHNLESSFRHELSPSERRGLRGLRSFEARLLRRSSESWMVSDADIHLAHELAPGAKLRLAPNVVDVAAIQPVFAPEAGPKAGSEAGSEVGPEAGPGAGPEAALEPGDAVGPEQSAIFVANFAYEPNRTALAFLLDDVLPRVWQELPGASLLLAGGGLEASPSEDPRVRAFGYVENLDNAYRQARCAVVPLLQGGGSPLKLIEALAHGLPVIATPRAVAGLRLHPGEDCLVADGGSAFAEALVRVLRDGAPEIARAGRRVAEERYSIEALAALIRA
jgi:glycosyltransferase involved in cell wall biosynthesis